MKLYNNLFLKCDQCVSLKDDLTHTQTELNDLTTERASNVQQINMLKAENVEISGQHQTVNSELQVKNKNLQRSLRKLVKYKVRIPLVLSHSSNFPVKGLERSVQLY